ncbi:hypothetical protein ACFYPC_33975 [Streptomyces sp. NPDC005808]|uniref:hypothetical protein n=1 Tax=Streptomyces sp. NPDC005808 TaxID=3364734 RepID=UPI0036AEB778
MPCAPSTSDGASTLEAEADEFGAHVAVLDPRLAYHLDGGASSKVVFTSACTTHVAGSMHYLRWPRSPGEPFRWQGLDGRVLRSAIAIAIAISSNGGGEPR